MQFRRVQARTPRTGARLGQRVNVWWKTWHSTDMEYPEPSPILFDGQNKVSFCQIFDLNIVFAACFCQSVMKGQLSLHHGLNVPGNMQFILVIKLQTFLCWILWFFCCHWQCCGWCWTGNCTEPITSRFRELRVSCFWVTLLIIVASEKPGPVQTESNGAKWCSHYN